MKRMYFLIALIFVLYNNYTQDEISLNEFTYAIDIFNTSDVIKKGDLNYLDHEFMNFSLALLNKNELRLLRNMIFAKYGYDFTSTELKTHFSKFNWYKPIVRNIDSKLTKIDKKNIELIETFEKIYENNKENNNYNNINLIGVWEDFLAADASGDGNFIEFYEKKNLIMNS